MKKKLIILLNILICLSAPFSVISFIIMLIYEYFPLLVERLLESIGITDPFLIMIILSLIASFPLILLTFKEELKK